jgi:phospholipid/cholesterol/gamma-HCH transport system substrate-binding protein
VIRAPRFHACWRRRDLLQNLNDLTAENSALAASLANVAGVTGKLNGPHGAMG